MQAAAPGLTSPGTLAKGARPDSGQNVNPAFRKPHSPSKLLLT